MCTNMQLSWAHACPRPQSGCGASFGVRLRGDAVRPCAWDPLRMRSSAPVSVILLPERRRNARRGAALPTSAMASMFSCCLACCGEGSAGHVPLKEMPAVQLDTHHMGTDVVIVKSGRRICGTGGCLANAPLHQNKSYFEFKVQSTGVWGVGVATQKANLNQIPMGRDIHSLVLRHDGSVFHNNEEKNRLPANSLPQEGDIVGVTYDHVEMNLYLNGKNMHCPASGIRGTVFPVVYVDDSAIIDCQFSDFYHTPPQGFEKILFEQQIF